jgi:hypothetical protein
MLRFVLSAAPDFMLGASYLLTWISPTAIGARSLQYLTLMAIFEFFVIHSSAFMGAVVYLGDVSRLVRVLMILGLLMFYSLFIVSISASFHEWWPVTAFCLLTLNRLTPLVFGTRPTEDQSSWQAGWAISVVLYLGWIFATMRTPLPHLGVTREMVAANIAKINGDWAREPYRLLAFGTGYFISQGAVELLRGLSARPSDAPVLDVSPIAQDGILHRTWRRR